MQIKASDIQKAGGIEKYFRKENKKYVSKIISTPKKTNVAMPEEIKKLTENSYIKIYSPTTRREANGWEKKYSEHLNALILSGDVVWYDFECLKFELAHRTTYTPDHIILYPDGTICADDVKGFMREDANVKIKVAARIFPDITFRVVKLEKNQWKLREVKK